MTKPGPPGACIGKNENQAQSAMSSGQAGRPRSHLHVCPAVDRQPAVARGDNPAQQLQVDDVLR